VNTRIITAAVRAALGMHPIQIPHAIHLPVFAYRIIKSQEKAA